MVVEQPLEKFNLEQSLYITFICFCVNKKSSIQIHNRKKVHSTQLLKMNIIHVPNSAIPKELNHRSTKKSIHAVGK